MKIYFLIFKPDKVHPMRICSLLILICPFFCHSETPNNATTYLQAEKLFLETFYEDALPLYIDLQNSNPNLDREQKLQNQLRIADCFLQMQDPVEALKVLQSIQNPVKNAPYFHYLLGKSHCDQQAYPFGLSAFTQIEQHPLSDFFLFLIYLEKGKIFYLTGQYEAAKKEFQNIQNTQIAGDLFFLATLYQVKIDLLQSKLADAMNQLTALSAIEPSDPRLKSEKIYLEAIALFQAQEINKSLNCFRTLLPKALLSTSTWSKAVIKKSLQCCFILALKNDLNENQLRSHFSEFESLIDYLLLHDSNNPQIIDFYLIKSKCLKDRQAYDTACQLRTLCKIPPSQFEAFKFAEAAQSSQERLNIYREIISNPSSSPSTLSRAWFYTGLNHLKQTSNSSDDSRNILQALAAFEQASLHFSKMHLYENAGDASESVIFTVILSKTEAALCYIHLQDWQNAQNQITQLLDQYPGIKHKTPLYFWMGYCFEHQQKLEKAGEFYKKAYENGQTGDFAAAAYFRLYPYQDYVHGKKEAIKHLRNMPKHFANEPLIIAAYYLIGLDKLKNHYLHDKLLYPKDLTQANEAFQMATTSFERLQACGKITDSNLNYFQFVNTLCQLERAKIHFDKSQAASDGKRIIYLQYCEEILKNLINSFAHNEKKTHNLLHENSGFAKAAVQSELLLAEVLQNLSKHDEALQTLNCIITHYEHESFCGSKYGLIMAWMNKGRAFYQNQCYEQALQAYQMADTLVKQSPVLSEDEFVDLFIQQSQCYKELGQLDDAMAQLSFAINQNLISSLRVKAMLLRAEIYTLQGRTDLALNQLIAVSKMSGQWAEQAKKQMESLHGF